VKIAMGSAAPKKGAITAFPSLPTQEGGWAFSVDQGLPGTRTLYVSTADKASWSFASNQPGPVDSDGWGNPGGMLLSSAKTVLYRNGKKLGRNNDPLSGAEPFRVPAGAADYKLTTSVRHSARISPLSTRVDASGQHLVGDDLQRVPGQVTGARG
jgi:hypothetical protein